jgi:hypothetical protein
MVAPTYVARPNHPSAVRYARRQQIKTTILLWMTALIVAVPGVAFVWWMLFGISDPYRMALSILLLCQLLALGILVFLMWIDDQRLKVYAEYDDAAAIYGAPSPGDDGTHSHYFSEKGGAMLLLEYRIQTNPLYGYLRRQ